MAACAGSPTGSIRRRSDPERGAPARGRRRRLGRPRPPPGPRDRPAEPAGAAQLRPGELGARGMGHGSWQPPAEGLDAARRRFRDHQAAPPGAPREVPGAHPRGRLRGGGPARGGSGGRRCLAGRRPSPRRHPGGRDAGHRRPARLADAAPPGDRWWLVPRRGDAAGRDRPRRHPAAPPDRLPGAPGQRAILGLAGGGLGGAGGGLDRRPAGGGGRRRGARGGGRGRPGHPAARRRPTRGSGDRGRRSCSLPHDLAARHRGHLGGRGADRVVVDPRAGRLHRRPPARGRVRPAGAGRLARPQPLGGGPGPAHRLRRRRDRPAGRARLGGRAPPPLRAGPGAGGAGLAAPAPAVARPRPGVPSAERRDAARRRRLPRRPAGHRPDLGALPGPPARLRGGAGRP